MTVIYNRTGGDPTFAKDVISENDQFSCWNGYDWGKLTYTIPRGIVTSPEINLPVWKRCLELATEFWNGTFKPVNKTWNSYMNKKTANPKNVNSWGKKMTDRVGKHHFGYLREHDPKYVFPGTMTPRPKASEKSDSATPATYIVKSGDTLSGIAKALGLKVQDLIAKNPKLKDPDRLAVGQKLNV